MLIAEIFADFDRHHAEHSSKPTRDFYRQGLRWLLNAFGSDDWESVERPKIMAALYASWHKPDGSAYANATHRRNKVAFGQLQRHANEQGFTEREILTKKDLKKPSSGRREVIPTADELEQLIAAATPAAAIAFRAFRASGMRPGELCRANIANIEATGKARSIVLKEHKTAKKTGKPRCIALGKELGRIVAEAIGERTEGPIWLDDRGERWTPTKLSDQFRRLKRKLALPEALTLYTIRHYVGTKVAKKNIYVAKELLGHKSITMTQRYAHGDEADQLKGQRILEGEEIDDDDEPRRAEDPGSGHHRAA